MSEACRGDGNSKGKCQDLIRGDVLSIGEDVFDVTGKVQAQGILVDGLGVGDVGNIVLRDRQQLSENGLLIVVVTLEAGSNQQVAGPDIVSVDLFMCVRQRT